MPSANRLRFSRDRGNITGFVYSYPQWPEPPGIAGVIEAA
jgi:hypothetical protein